MDENLNSRASGTRKAVKAILKLLLDHPRSQHRWIGIESERFLRSSQGSIVHYDPVIRQIFESLKLKDWRLEYENEGAVLGLSKSLSSLSLEPGAQFEVSPAPVGTVFEFQALEKKIDSQIFAESPSGLFFGSEAFNQQEAVDQIPLLPSARYRIMDRYFTRDGGRGREMMRKTCGLQINLDYSSEAEGLSMLRASFQLAPFLATLFSNSKTDIAMSERRMIWMTMDSRRCGIIPEAVTRDFTFERYAEIVSLLPLMYYYDKNDQTHDADGKSLSDLSDELIEHNALAACRQIFTEARFKPCCVEVRFFDQQTPEFRLAAISMIVGLLYDSENRDFIHQELKMASAQELADWMKDGAIQGMKAKGIYTFCIELFKMAKRGLERRGFNEEVFLDPVENLLEKSVTVAELSL